jgi:hypothetical protein
MERQELAHPGLDFAKACIGPEAPIDQRMQDAAVAWGRRQAAAALPKLPVPDNDAVARLRTSLAGTGNVDLSGGASTIQTDIDRWRDAERGRQVLNDPCFEEAMANASIRAAKEGRKTTAADFNAAMAEVKAKRGPQPPRPPQPVTPLLTGTAAKATTSSLSPVPDRFRS